MQPTHPLQPLQPTAVIATHCSHCNPHSHRKSTQPSQPHTAVILSEAKNPCILPVSAHHACSQKQKKADTESLSPTSLTHPQKVPSNGSLIAIGAALTDPKGVILSEAPGSLIAIGAAALTYPKGVILSEANGSLIAIGEVEGSAFPSTGTAPKQARHQHPPSPAR
jgi:hypothetical protein